MHEVKSLFHRPKAVVADNDPALFRFQACFADGFADKADVRVNTLQGAQRLRMFGTPEVLVMIEVR